MNSETGGRFENLILRKMEWDLKGQIDIDIDLELGFGVKEWTFLSYEDDQDLAS